MMKLSVGAMVIALSALLAAPAPSAGAAEPETPAVLRADRPGPIVDRHIFSQFSEHLGAGIYGGIWVGPNAAIANFRGYRLDVLKALKDLKIPAIRWPGGCFADQYHWRDGIGRRDKRPVRLNVLWGGVAETNGFGTHEFMDLTELLGADAYLAINVGSSTPQEAEDWIEYLTSDSHSALAEERRRNGRDRPWKVPFVGVGNESWGCGGSMTAEYYSDLYRRFQTFIADEAGQKHLKIASGANSGDLAWTETLMRRNAPLLQALSLHQYTIPTGAWTHKGSSTDFGVEEYAAVLAGAYDMDRLIKSHVAVMNRFDPDNKIALMVDEWGVWTDPLPGTNPGFLRQQNSLRDALAAAVTLNVFAANAERVKMAAIAQTVNVLQAMILTDGPRMVLTPTYHVFRLYKPFQDAARLALDFASPSYDIGTTTVPAISAAAVRGGDGIVHLALINVDPDHPAGLAIRLEGLAATVVHGEVLTGPAVTSVNSFDQPAVVAPAPFSDARIVDGVMHVDLPAKSLVVLDVQ